MNFYNNSVQDFFSKRPQLVLMDSLILYMSTFKNKDIMNMENVILFIQRVTYKEMELNL